jgi:hypothetical protein
MGNATPGYGWIPEGHPIGPPVGKPSLLYWAAVVAFYAGYKPPLIMPQLWEGDNA